MSIHRSLVPPSKLRRHRNVLSRSERIERLKGEARWEEDQSVFGLVKVRNIQMKAKKKKKEKAEDGAGGVEAAAAEGAASGGAAKKEEKKEKKK